MKAGSMEGLVGASINMKLTRTPMRVYKEAEIKGDTEVMKRAMGYVTEFREKAHDYSEKAQKELPKELKEERREQEIRRKQALERKEKSEKYIENIQEKNGEYIEKIQGNRPDIPKANDAQNKSDIPKVNDTENKPGIPKTDHAEISAEGKQVFENNFPATLTVSVLEPSDVKMYTSEGKPVSTGGTGGTGGNKIDVMV